MPASIRRGQSDRLSLQTVLVTVQLTASRWHRASCGQPRRTPGGMFIARQCTREERSGWPPNRRNSPALNPSCAPVRSRRCPLARRRGTFVELARWTAIGPANRGDMGVSLWPEGGSPRLVNWHDASLPDDSPWHTKSQHKCGRFHVASLFFRSPSPLGSFYCARQARGAFGAV